MAVDVEAELYEQAEHTLNVRKLRRLKAMLHPAFMIHFMLCVDAKTGEEFRFDLLSEEERSSIDLEGKPGKWFWHREMLESFIREEVSLVYKARQIGITWLAAAYGLWMVLSHPGTRFLIISINEGEAIKVIARIWGMYNSLPSFMTDHMTLTKPSRGGSPSQEIEWTADDGKVSSILALASTAKAGHGETAGLVLLDEHARQEFARESWKAAFPVIDGGGQAIIVSTANGVSTEDGEGEAQGNFFHYLWTNATSMKIWRVFLGVFTHPDRDDRWYTEKAARLPASDRAEQYPRTPEEGFIGTGHCWFDLEKLNAYQTAWRASGRKWLYRMSVVETHRKAALVHKDNGEWRIYVEPEPGHGYAIAADVASGSGDDFSSAHVIDLTNGQWVAEYHARVEEDVYAKDLYYAGKWYGAQNHCVGDALVAVEKQGGYGTATIIALRDGVKGRKPYTKLYRHSTGPEETTDPDEREAFGFPMGQATRPLVINQLEQWIREQTCPWITPDLDAELRTFSKRKTRPSPRALEGCNDDRVMSAAVSLELYRQFGFFATRRRAKSTKGRWKRSQYSWEK